MFSICESCRPGIAFQRLLEESKESNCRTAPHEDCVFQVSITSSKLHSRSHLFPRSNSPASQSAVQVVCGRVSLLNLLRRFEVVHFQQQRLMAGFEALVVAVPGLLSLEVTGASETSHFFLRSRRTRTKRLAP